MELLGDTGHVESRFGALGDGVSVGARQVHGLRQTYHRLRKSFWMHPMVLLGDGVMWNLVSVCLETVFVSVQDRCIVCAKRTIGSEIILHTPDGTPR